MRRFLIALAIVAVFSTAGWADEILDVNISGTFVATQLCSSNCTETVAISFEFDPGAYPRPASPGYAVPGTMEISSFGFLDTFSSESDSINLD